MKVILMLFLFFCLISQTMASVKVATIDMADLFENDPEIIALQKKVKAKQVKIKAENEKLLIEIRAKHAKIDAITRKIKNPKITKKERKDLLRMRQLVSHSMPTDPTLYHRKLEAIQRAINVEIHMEMRKFLFRIEKETKQYAQVNKIDLLLNKSLKGNHKRPFLVYATIELDVTKQIQTGEKSSKLVGLELNKLNVATINLDQLLKQEKLERITEIVEVYAKKNGIHLVFDSSAESSSYSKVILSSRRAVDLTKLVSQKPE